MFRRNPDGPWFSSTGAILVFLVSLLTLILLVDGFGVLGDRPPQSSISPQYQSSQDANTTYKKTTSPANIQPNNPAAEADDYYHNAKSDNQSLTDLEKKVIAYRDLAAQEGMWRTTYLLTITTILQLLVVGITLWLVFDTLSAGTKTLDASLRAITIANETLAQAKETTIAANKATQVAIRAAEAAESADRPHVYLDVIPKYGEAKRTVSISIRFSNFGKSPARDLIGEIRYIPDDRPVKFDGARVVEVDAELNCIRYPVPIIIKPIGVAAVSGNRSTEFVFEKTERTSSILDNRTRVLSAWWEYFDSRFVKTRIEAIYSLNIRRPGDELHRGPHGEKNMWFQDNIDGPPTITTVYWSEKEVERHNTKT